MSSPGLQEDASPATTLLSVLGEHWWQQAAPLPSAALVALLSDFGISDAAARSTLTRLVGRRLLSVKKIGRRTYYNLSSRAQSVLADGAHRIFGLGRESGPWDGRWTVLMFSVPEANRPMRDALRARLRWLGMAPLYDAVWIAPHDRKEAISGVLTELSLTTATMLTTDDVFPLDGQGWQRAWDVEALMLEYETFIACARSTLVRLAEGAVGPERALVARTRATNAWQRLRRLDPDLPDELLPPAWNRAAAREAFELVYEALGSLARERVAAIVTRFAPELADLVNYRRTVAEVLSGYRVD